MFCQIGDNENIPPKLQIDVYPFFPLKLLKLKIRNRAHNYREAHFFEAYCVAICCLFSASRRNLVRVSLCHAGPMLVSEHRFRIPNLELTWMGTQYGRCETKANVTYCYLRYLLCSIYSTGNHRSRIYIFSNTLNPMGFDLKKIL